MAGLYRGFKIKQGNTFNPYIIWKTNGVANNLANYEGRFKMVKNPGQAEPDLLLETTDVGGMSKVDAQGKMQLTGATPAVTAALTPGVYFYDWEIFDESDPDSDAIGLLTGNIEVEAQA